MAAATAHDNNGTTPGFTPPYGPTLRFHVMWNGQVVALCTTLAEANAVAATHPA